MARGQIDVFMQAIAAIESGGSADPVNVQHGRTGAHGLFQIMPQNWSPWAQEAGLGPNAPRTAENQRKVARHKMLSYYDQFGSWDAVAVAWFAGPGRAQRYQQGDRSVLNLSDGHSTVQQYVTRLGSEMESATQAAPQDVGAYGAEMNYDAGATLAEVFGTLSDRAAGRDRALRRSYGGAPAEVDYQALSANTTSPFGSALLDDGGLASAPPQSLDVPSLDDAPDLATEAPEGDADGPMVAQDYATFGQVTQAPTGAEQTEAGLQSAISSVFAAQGAADGGPVAEVGVLGDPLGTQDDDGSTAAVLQVAEQYLDVPYVWGGTSPEEGFDCSGLVQYVFREMGIDLPRTSAEQAQQGQAVASLDDARPGDLVFWRGTDGSPNHIGIYAGNGRFIEAPLPGQGVRYRQIGQQPDAIRRVM